jgi:hypothetical protein
MVLGEAVKLVITGAATTAKLAVPCTDPEVAAMVVDPALTVLALPVAFIVATVVLPDAHVTELEMSALLLSV